MFNIKSRETFLLFFIYCIFICFFSYNFISAEDKIYECMYLESNVNYFELFSIKASSVKEYWSNIYFLMTTCPLNFIIILPLYPFYKIFGDISREGFIIGIQLFYMVPLLFILINLFYSRLAKYSVNNTTFNIFVICSFLFCAPIHYLVLRGYASICAFIPLFILLYIAMSTKFEERIGFKKILLFGLLIYLVFHLRRFLLIADISIIATSFLFALYRIVKSNEKSLKELFTKLCCLVNNLFVFPACISLILFYIFQRDNFFAYFKFSSDIYTAYNTVSFFDNLNGFYYYFGLVNTILLIASSLIILFVKNENRKNAIFILFTALGYLLAFLFYEIFTEYLFFFYILSILLFLYSVSLLFNKINSFFPKMLVKFSIIFLIIYVMFNFVLLFLPKESFSENIYSKFEKIHIKPDDSMKFYPYSFYKKESFLEVYDFIKNEIKDESDICITAYATTHLFNYWLLYSYSSFDDKIIKNHMYRTAEYFSFEAIEAENLDSKYVIVTDPIRLFHEEKDFLPLFKAGKAFINNQNIAKNYELIFKKEYEYEKYFHNPIVTIYIYKKNKPVEPELVRELYDSIIQEAPKYKDIYDEKYKEYVDFYNKKYNL